MIEKINLSLKKADNKSKPFMKSFDLEHAERILIHDSNWSLTDPNYIFSGGKISPKSKSKD